MLKSLLGPRSSRSRKSSGHPQLLPAGAFSAMDNPRASSDDVIDLSRLTAELARHASKTSDKSKAAPEHSRSLFRKKQKSYGNFQDKLHQAVEAIEAAGRVDPYLQSTTPQDGYVKPQALYLPPVSQHSTGPAVSTVYATPLQSPAPLATGDEWYTAYQSCSAALCAGQALSHNAATLATVMRARVSSCTALLQAQRDELQGMSIWAEDKPILSFGTLAQVYTEITHGLEQIVADPSTGSVGILTILQVLREGPDYLIDIGLVECVIWQAEVIDPGYGANLQNLLDDAVSAQLPLAQFRRSLGTVIKASLSPPDGAVDDDLSRDAFQAIESLVKQLGERIQVRVAPTQQSHTPASPIASSSGTPAAASPALSASPSPNTSPAGYTPHNAKTLQDRYGTGIGPLPPGASSYFPPPSGPASPYPTRPASPSPPSPVSTSSSQKSIFEYRGHRLTRSALELVQTQERLAMADSSGQYAGDVSWDDLRNAWVPKWAEKLKPGDVAEGEVPDTNPANYKTRDRDEWGNKIGWYEGRMYYEEEPSFDLRD